MARSKNIFVCKTGNVSQNRSYRDFILAVPVLAFGTVDHVDFGGLQHVRPFLGVGLHGPPAGHNGRGSFVEILVF